MSHCDVIDDVITMKNYFSGITWDDPVIFDVKLKLCLIFGHFQNGCHFEVATNFFTVSDTGSLIYQQDNNNHFRQFQYLIDAIAQILIKIWQFEIAVYLGNWWRH